jgi:hypothetical protein
MGVIPQSPSCRSDPTDTTNGKFHNEEEEVPVKISSDAAGEKVQV